MIQILPFSIQPTASFASGSDVAKIIPLANMPVTASRAAVSGDLGPTGPKYVIVSSSRVVIL